MPVERNPYANYGQRVPLANVGEDGKVVEKKTWTVREINEMTSQQYNEMLRNPAFVAAIDGSPEPPKE